MIDDEAIVRRLRREFPDTAAVYRFGSTVQGGARADSDVDLAILPDRPVDPLRRFAVFAVQEQLASEKNTPTTIAICWRINVVRIRSS